jgi:cobaltochelatase CobS
MATDNSRGQGDARGHYAGVDVMNSATMDRFRVMIVMDYMSKAQEKKVLKNTVPGMTDLLAKKMIEVAWRVRAGYSAGDLSETLSMRPLIEWAEKAILTRDIMGSLKITMLNKIESESERQEITAYVQSVFGSLLEEK